VTHVAFLALVVACTALLCGHQGQPFPLRAACGWLRGRLTASQDRRALRVHPAHERAPHAPLWAHTQPLDYQETA
jgi:hypothetical protein